MREKALATRFVLHFARGALDTTAAELRAMGDRERERLAELLGVSTRLRRGRVELWGLRPGRRGTAPAGC